MTESVTLQGVLQRYLSDYRQTHTLDARRLAVCRHVTDCRTAALGGLHLHCDRCGDDATHYFSCRDRHCPQCQQRASAQWRDKQQDNLLPATYFHLVFTLPAAINGCTQRSSTVCCLAWFGKRSRPLAPTPNA